MDIFQAHGALTAKSAELEKALTAGRKRGIFSEKGERALIEADSLRRSFERQILRAGSTING